MLRYIVTLLGAALLTASASASESIDSVAATSQLPGYNVYVQLVGSNLGLGAGFDTRFTPTSKFGYSVGMAYTCTSFGHDNSPAIDCEGVTIPLEVNGIFGKHKSKFEIGISAVPAIVHRCYTEWTYINGTEISRHDHGTRVNIYGVLNLGYRYQRRSGFFMRVGVAFCIGHRSCSPFDGGYMVPGLCLGYTIGR